MVPGGCRREVRALTFGLWTSSPGLRCVAGKSEARVPNSRRGASGCTVGAKRSELRPPGSICRSEPETSCPEARRVDLRASRSEPEARSSQSNLDARSSALGIPSFLLRFPTFLMGTRSHLVRLFASQVTGFKTFVTLLCERPWIPRSLFGACEIISHATYAKSFRNLTPMPSTRTPRLRAEGPGIIPALGNAQGQDRQPRRAESPAPNRLRILEPMERAFSMQSPPRSPACLPLPPSTLRAACPWLS